MNRSKEVFADPVELPPTVDHCGPQAYNVYKCRCKYCVTWSRLYGRAKDARRYATVVRERDGYRDYLASRGIQLVGPGPFRKNSRNLARLVAQYFNDDLSYWIKPKGTRS